MMETNNKKYAFIHLPNLAKIVGLIDENENECKTINLCCHCKQFYWDVLKNVNFEIIDNFDIVKHSEQRGEDIIRFIDNFPNAFYNDGSSLMIDNFIPFAQKLNDFVFVSPSCRHQKTQVFIKRDDIDSGLKCLISPVVNALSLSTNKDIQLSLENLKNPIFGQYEFSCTRKDEIMQKLSDSISNSVNFIMFVRSKNMDIPNILCNNLKKFAHFINSSKEFVNTIVLEKLLNQDSRFELVPTFFNAQSLLENVEFRKIFTDHKGPIIFQTDFDHSLSDYAFSLAHETIVDSRK